MSWYEMIYTASVACAIEHILQCSFTKYICIHGCVDTQLPKKLTFVGAYFCFCGDFGGVEGLTCIRPSKFFSGD